MLAAGHSIGRRLPAVFVIFFAKTKSRKFREPNFMFAKVFEKKRRVEPENEHNVKHITEVRKIRTDVRRFCNQGTSVLPEPDVTDADLARKRRNAERARSRSRDRKKVLKRGRSRGRSRSKGTPGNDPNIISQKNDMERLLDGIDKEKNNYTTTL